MKINEFQKLLNDLMRENERLRYQDRIDDFGNFSTTEKQAFSSMDLQIRTSYK